MVLAITGSLPGRPWALLIIMEIDPLNQEHDRPSCIAKMSLNKVHLCDCTQKRKDFIFEGGFLFCLTLYSCTVQRLQIDFACLYSALYANMLFVGAFLYSLC